jgi:ketosteroid isomerase-like protein
MSQLIVDRLIEAINSHDIEDLVACFAPDFSMTWPAHPERSFSGPSGVRRNWEALFKAFPDMHASISDRVHKGEECWGEWEFVGHSITGGQDFWQRGVIVIRARGDVIAQSRFYMEPVSGEDPAGTGPR